MPRGSKESYTGKQKRQAEHIEEGYIDSGVSRKEAEKRAWATVNKQDGGGKKSGSARKQGSSSSNGKSAKSSSSKSSASSKSSSSKKSTSRKSS